MNANFKISFHPPTECDKPECACHAMVKRGLHRVKNAYQRRDYFTGEVVTEDALSTTQKGD